MSSEAQVEDILDAVPPRIQPRFETLPSGHEVSIIIQTLVTVLGDVKLTSVSKQSIVLIHVKFCELVLLGSVTRFYVSSIGGISVELLYQRVQRLLDHAVLCDNLVL